MKTLILILFLLAFQQQPQPKKKQTVYEVYKNGAIKLMQDTVKMDTIPLPVQQKVYSQQMAKQLTKMDSLLIKKEKSK